MDRKEAEQEALYYAAKAIAMSGIGSSSFVEMKHEMCVKSGLPQVEQDKHMVMWCGMTWEEYVKIKECTEEIIQELLRRSGYTKIDIPGRHSVQLRE